MCREPLPRRRKRPPRGLRMAIPNDRGDESFADDLNMGRGIVSGRVALLLRSTEIRPPVPTICATPLLHPFFLLPPPNSRVLSRHLPTIYFAQITSSPCSAAGLGPGSFHSRCGSELHRDSNPGVGGSRTQSGLQSGLEPGSMRDRDSPGLALGSNRSGSSFGTLCGTGTRE